MNEYRSVEETLSDEKFMSSYSLQQALLNQQSLASRFPLMGGLGNGMPWPFPPHANNRGPETLAPFPVSEFIKHAAQQQLQAQLKVRGKIRILNEKSTLMWGLSCLSNHSIILTS